MTPIVLFAFQNFGEGKRLYLTPFLASCVYLHGLLTLKKLKAVWGYLDMQNREFVHTKTVFECLFGTLGGD